MNNQINIILKEIEKAQIEYIDVSRYKFKHHSASKVEPLMSKEDYESLKHNIVEIGRVHTPVIIYNDKVLDGRHRQKVCVELNYTMPIKRLTGNYNQMSLEEVVRSIHMNRNKTKIQRDIQAYRFKQTVANVTWKEAALKYSTSESSIKRINSIANFMKKHSMIDDFELVLSKFEHGLILHPKHFSWLIAPTGTFSGALKQLKEFILNKQEKNKYEEIDTTKYDIKTGEELKKHSNIYLSEEQTIIQLKEENEQLKKEIIQLKKQLKGEPK